MVRGEEGCCHHVTVPALPPTDLVQGTLLANLDGMKDSSIIGRWIRARHVSMCERRDGSQRGPGTHHSDLDDCVEQPVDVEE